MARTTGSGDYGLRWRSTSKNGRLATRTRYFRTAEARDSFATVVSENPNFAEFVAWSDLEPTPRERRLAAIREAIRQGRAVLNTAWGRRKVVGYNPETGWAITNNRGVYTDQQSFMVTEDSIHILPQPVERR